jgi:hypothetical protein
MKPSVARHRLLVTIVIAAALIAPVVLGSQGQSTPSTTPSAPVAARGRGTPPVQPLLDPGGHVRDDAFVPGPALSDADRIYTDIDGRRMKTIVNDVVAISRKSRDDGNKYWGRIAGTKYEAMTGDLIEAKFRSLGMTDVHRKEFDLPPTWFPIDWSLSATGSGQTQTFKTLLPALHSVPITGTLDLEAVWVGLGTAADFAGRNVRGKAVVIHTMLAPGEMGQSAVIEGSIRRAEDAGAAAIIGIWGYYDNYAVWQSLGRTVYSSDVKIPAFWVGFEDGKLLRDQIAAGPTHLTMRLTTDMRSGLKTQSVYGTLPGTTDESVIVLAHMDGWFDAALDNASGLSVMLTLAEHFAKVPRAERRRNIIFVGTAGHHVGSPNSTYLRDQRPDLLAKTALMINCEHVAGAQTLNWNTHLRDTTGVAPRRWWVNGSRRLTDIVLGAYQKFGVNVVADMDPSASGEMGAIATLAPSIQIIHSPEIKHTDHDVPEGVPAPGLEAIGRAYAKIIDEVNRLDRTAVLPAAAPGRSGAR